MHNRCFKMRKLLLVILFFLVACVATSAFFFGHERTPMERFKEGMNFARFVTYTDSDFDYQFEYPSFLRQEQVDGYGCGHVRFGYHDGVNIVMECKVVPESVYTFRRGDLIRRGLLDDMPDYAYASHYIRRDKRWYVLTLYSPSDYQKAVARILYKVEKWRADMPFKLFPKRSHHERKAR